MKCPKCQFENPESAKFCNECGNKLELVCPGCGKQNPVGSKFCNDCGQNLEEVLETEEKVPEAEGERKYVTVLFSDLSGYTAMSEKLDPEDVKEITSRIFGEISKVINRYEGFVEKFVGDAVMALFGVPKAHEDDPIRAIRAAKEIHDLVDSFSPEIEERIGQTVSMHSGINTGLVVTGEVDMEKGTHGVAGDTINLASRLSGVANPGEILISPGTRELITPYFETEALEAVTMKGKAQPMIPYRVVGVLTASTRFEAAEQRGLIAFTGREQELAVLHSCLDKAMARSGQFVTVVGEAGVGKSRLLYELRHSPNRDKITVLEGRCQSYGSNTPYFPFLNALRRGLHLREEDTPAELLEKTVTNVVAIDQTLEQYLPLYLHLLSIPSEDYPLPKHLQGAELKSAFEDALAALNTLNSQGQPMVLILEDWHWADEASDSALKHLVGVMAPYPLMVVVVYRPEYDSNWGSWSYHTPIVLKSLDTQHSENIIKSVWGAARLPKGLTLLIHERTGGNPLFIEEVCNALAEEGAVQVKDSQAVLTRPLEHLTLPDTVQAVIRARLDRLDRYARETLGLASVIGREFARHILERISASRDRLSQSLETLKVLELIQQIRVVPEAAYTFKQVLTQEVTYETLLRQQRRKLHGSVGRATEEAYADRIEEQYELLAHHYGLAEDWEKAVHFGRLAAEKAHKLSQFQQAVTLYEQTKEWLLKLPENKIRQERLVDIRLEICQSNTGLGQFEKAVEVGLQAEDTSKELGDRARLGMTYLGLSIAYVYQGNFKKTEHYALQAKQYLEGTGEEWSLAVARRFWECVISGRGCGGNPSHIFPKP
jgi:class 3 adenylate cyclase